MQKKQGKGKSQNFQKPRRATPQVSARSKNVRPSTTSHQVGVASYASQPRKRAPRMTQQGSSSCRVSGSDYLATVSIGSSTAAGFPILTVDLAPMNIKLARLQTLSGLYERYTYHRLTFKYCPSCPTTQAGQLIGYIDRDVSQVPLSGTGTYDSNLRRAYAMFGEKPVQVWQGGDRPVSWTLKSDSKLTELYTANVSSTGADPKWASPGRFVMLAASNFDTAVTVGTLYVDYDIEFKYPQWNSPITGLPGTASQFRGGGGSTSLTPLNLFPADSVKTYSWSDSRVQIVPDTNSIYFQPGIYFVYGLATYVTDLTAVIISDDGDLTHVSAVGGTDATEILGNVMCTVYVGSGGGRVSFKFEGTYGPASKSQFYVFRMPPNTVTEDVQVPSSADSKEAKVASSLKGAKKLVVVSKRSLEPSGSTTSAATSSSTSSITSATAASMTSWFKV